MLIALRPPFNRLSISLILPPYITDLYFVLNALLKCRDLVPSLLPDSAAQEFMCQFLPQ